MNKDQYKDVLSKIWIALGSGNRLNDLDVLADQIQMEKTAFKTTFPDRNKIILALVEDIWGRLDLPQKSEKLTVRDQIFDAVMMVFDLVSPYREGIKKLCHELIISPTSYLELSPRLYRFGSDILARYMKVDGLLAVPTIIAFNGAFATAFWTFLDDDTFDLSKTMSSLDGALKTVESLLSYCPGSAYNNVLT